MSRGVRFKSKFHLMWRVPSQQEPGSTVSFLYIVHSVSVCAARGCGGLAVDTVSFCLSCLPLFISFPFTYNFSVVPTWILEVCFDVLTGFCNCFDFRQFQFRQCEWAQHLKGQKSRGSVVQSPPCASCSARTLTYRSAMCHTEFLGSECTLQVRMPAYFGRMCVCITRRWFM